MYQIDPIKRKIRILSSTGGLLLGLALDRDNNIYICDAKHRVVQKIASDGRVQTFIT